MAGSKALTAAQCAGGRRMCSSMLELIGRFGSEEACERHMISLRWPGGFECPRCRCRECAKVATRREWRCVGCNWQFSATSGTLIAHTMLPLAKWFRAAWLVATDTRGASGQAVARECGVSEPTGLAMLRRLRAAMGFAMSLCEVGGDWVELDGADVACGNKGGEVRRAGSGATDAPVLAAVSGSRLALRSVSDQTAGSVAEFCSAHVSRNHQVRCDEHPSYDQALPGGWDLLRRPSAADGDSEGSLPVVHHVISNLKAELLCTHHGVSSAHLQEYCDEFSWRYCHRRGDPFADLLAELVRWPHAPLGELLSQHGPQGPHASARDPGYKHNRRLEAWWFKELRRRVLRCLVLAAEQKVAAVTRL